MELKELLQILSRRWRLVLLAFTLVFFSCVAGALVLPKVYATSVKLLYLESSALMNVGTLTGATQAIRSGETANFTHMELMKNTRLLTELINTLELKTYSGHPLTVKKLLRSTPLISMIRPRPRISINHAPESFVLVIEASSPDPEEAARMANLLGEMYMEDIQGRQSLMLRQTQQNMDSTLTALKTRYFDALDRLARASKEEGTADISTETAQALETYYELMVRKFSAMEELSRSMATLDVIGRQLDKVKTTSIPGRAFSGHSAIENLSATIQQLRASLAAAHIEKTENHPDVLELKLQIDELSQLLAHEVKVFRETATDLEDAERAVQGYRDLVASLESLLGEFAQRLLALPEKSARIGRVSSEVMHLNTMIENLSGSLSSLHSARARTHNMIQMMQPAMVKERGDHDKPNETLLLLVGMILGTITSVGLACLMDYLDTRVHSPQMLRRAEVPLLATVPDLGKKGDEDRAAVFRSLRNRISLSFSSQNWKVLLVASVFPAGGATTIAQNLARSMAGRERRVILLEMPPDHAFPWSPQNNTPGAWKDHVAPFGNATFLDRLTLRGNAHNGMESSIRSLESLLSELAETYDCIIMDSGPFSLNEDPLLLGSIIDGVAPVMTVYQVPLGRAREVHEICRKSGITNLGFILNRYREGSLE